MIRIRRIYDDSLASSRHALDEVDLILQARFPLLSEEDRRSVRSALRNPFKKGFQGVLFVAEGMKRALSGFAYVLRDPGLGLVYLEYIATHERVAQRGVGGALYETVRDFATDVGARGIFMECLPDEPGDCHDEPILAENRARLAFYERYGARPIIGTAYETPVLPTDTCPPYLVFDGLGKDEPLRSDTVRRVVKAILERKYKHLCPPEYVAKVLKSIRGEQVELRAARYTKRRPALAIAPGKTRLTVRMTLNAAHSIHHVRERGYVEAPVRVARIEKELLASGRFASMKVKHFADSHVTAVHDPKLVKYIERTCASIPEGRAVYPYVFPIRNAAREPKDATVRAGYYCIDTFTPLHVNAFRAARNAVDCALTSASAILDGDRLSYALVRPPGHHAERRTFGGFCYLNNNAIAAHYLSQHGNVAILDLDYHHGNGQQEIFYERSDVLTLSIHGHPSFAYPYFSGFEDECGSAAGEGFNQNFPLPEKLTWAEYKKALRKAMARVTAFRPNFLVLAFGLDTARGDPTGTWSLAAADFRAMGGEIASLDLPTVVIQEGGYRTRSLGQNARAFFEGFLGVLVAR